MTSVAFVATCLVAPPVGADQQPQQRPNVVVILADDLGYGDLSCYGATKVQTPNIDRLAERGMRFTDAHSPHSVCTPTRYALLTGRYAWRTWVKHRCVWSDDPLLIDTNRLTLPKLLKSAGYRTAGIGKWHLGFGSPNSPGWDAQKGPDYNGALKPGPLECGFDYFFGIPHVGQHPHVYIENHQIVGLDSEDPIQIVLDQRNRNRESYRDRQNITPWHEFTGGEAALYEHEDLAIQLTERAVDWIDRQQHEPFFLYFAPRNVHSPLKPHPRFAGKSQIGVYGDFILELDWSVGQILEALERKGITENTLVVFSSDNGGVQKGHRPAHIVDYNGHKANGPLRGQKTEVYEGGHRVPLIARWPGKIPAGTENDSLVALLDIIATSVELLDQELPDTAAPDSYSFLHELLGGEPSGPVRDHLIMNANDDKGYWAVREGDWKLILGRHGGGSIGPPNPVKQTGPEGQLYDLSGDLDESNNLYDQHPDKVRQLTALLEQTRHPRDRSRSGRIHWEPRSFDLGQPIWSTESIDVNADGARDLVAVGATHVWAMLAPSWESVQLAATPGGKTIHSVALDCDADGDVDLALGRSASDWIAHRQAQSTGKPSSPPQGDDWTVAWLENTGRTDQPWPLHTLDRQLHGVHGLWRGDVNRDGSIDLLADSFAGPHLESSLAWFALPNSQQLAPEISRRLISEGKATGRPHYMDFADVDGDGRGDVLLGASSEGSFTWWQQPADLATPWKRHIIAWQDGATHPRAADLNGDGMPDVIGSAGHGNGVYWYAAPGWEKHVIDESVRDVHAFDAADLDQDGDIDCAGCSYSQHVVLWWENLGNATFRPHRIATDQEAYDLKIADLDADGRLDILLAGRRDENVVWYRNVPPQADDQASP